MKEIIYYIGQLLGFAAIIFGFVSYQMKTKTGVLIFQSATTLAFTLHYLLIGALSGMALNLIALVRNVVFWRFGDRKIPKSLSIGFALVMGVVGILNWDGWFSIFILLGLVINSYCMSFENPQSIRKSILVTSPLVIVYNAFVLSVGGIVYESIAIISSIIGIVRNRKDVKTTQ